MIFVAYSAKGNANGDPRVNAYAAKEIANHRRVLKQGWNLNDKTGNGAKKGPVLLFPPYAINARDGKGGEPSGDGDLA